VIRDSFDSTPDNVFDAIGDAIEISFEVGLPNPDDMPSISAQSC
jgi:hypothetical protein